MHLLLFMKPTCHCFQKHCFLENTFFYNLVEISTVLRDLFHFRENRNVFAYKNKSCKKLYELLWNRIF